MFLRIFLLLGIIVCVASADNGFRCDYTYDDDAYGWLKYQKVPANWHDARLRCHLEGAVLASPLNFRMRKAMLRMTKANFDIFTGYHATFSKEDYHSVEGLPVDKYAQWVTGEPDNWENSEDCLYMTSSGNLGDMNCELTRPYICYKKYNPKDRRNECGTIDSDYHFYNSTGSCYKFHRVPRKWSRAFMACTAEGGYLAIINSKTEAKAIAAIFAKNPATSMVGHFWKDVAFVGFHDWGEHGEYLTIEGQTLKEAGYDLFSPGEPNNSTTGEYCGSVYRTALLNDLWCENSYAFICEKDPKSLVC
ncbi:macrophage mannose receptor 1-like [Vanessa tameamea]|uniref:Macrophage mannose receptor 1-like n=1 Tax=Vanessa tameamea TaxID=334116 RepID=A0ABM4AKR6_VANTA